MELKSCYLMEKQLGKLRKLCNNKKRIFMMLLFIIIGISILGEDIVTDFTIKDYIEFGDRLRRRGDTENALTVYKEGLREDASNQELLLRILDIYKVRNIDITEEEIFIALMIENADNPPFLFALGYHQLELGKKEKAFEIFEAYLELKNEKNSDNIFFVGDLYFKSNLYEKAFNAFTSDKEENYKNLFGAAVTSRLLGEFRKSIDYYKKLIEEKGSFAEAYLGLGICFKMIDEIDLAIDSFKKYLEFDKDEKVFVELTTLYMLKKNNTEARIYAEKGLQNYPNSTELRDLLFEIFSIIR